MTNYGAKQGTDQGATTWAHGTTEIDVFTACDTLLLAGERPTIERVRQKIGCGSPNTVSPMLDAWLTGLRRRLQDPGALVARPPNVPEPVMQVAAWVGVEKRVVERLVPMRTEVDRAYRAEVLAHTERDAEVARTREARQGLGDLGARLEAEHVAHASTAVRERAALDQLAGLADRR